ncbi:MAG: hypothetical protein ACTHKB_15520 [Burkholderiaceae bacterium]
MLLFRLSTISVDNFVGKPLLTSETANTGAGFTGLLKALAKNRLFKINDLAHPWNAAQKCSAKMSTPRAQGNFVYNLRMRLTCGSISW